MHRRFRRFVCEEAAKAARETSEPGKSHSEHPVISASVVQGGKSQGKTQLRFSEAAIASALHVAHSSRLAVLKEMEVCSSSIRDHLAARAASTSLERHSDQQSLHALLLQHSRLQFEADELAADLAFLEACRILMSRGGGDRKLSMLQLSAALRVLHEADVIVTTLAGAASLATLRLHPVLEVR